MYDCRSQQLVQTFSAADVKSRGILLLNHSGGILEKMCKLGFPPILGMCMCVRAWCDDSKGLPLVLAGFDDGSLLLWEARRPSAELTSLKLYSEPGVISVASWPSTSHVCPFCEAVMCVALDREGLGGVCGSPSNSLEAFSLSAEKVNEDMLGEIELPAVCVSL